MKAIRVHEPGGPEVLRYEEVPDPQPGPGEVLIENRAAGINFADVGRRRNLIPAGSSPSAAARGAYGASSVETAGGEAAGRVLAVGEGVSGFKPGDYVACQGTEYMPKTGGYSEQVVCRAGHVIKVPGEITPEVAVAGAMLQGLTAHALALGAYHIKPGDRVLVHAGAGGVGTMLSQICKIAGAYVYATVGSDAKIPIAKEAGAGEVINYSTDDFEARIKDATKGQGVNAVFDAVGKTTFRGSLGSLAPLGMLVLYGAASGPVEPFRLGELGGKYVTSTRMTHHTATDEAWQKRASELLDWLQQGKLRTWVTTYPLAQACDAHRDLENRATTGKLILIP